MESGTASGNITIQDVIKANRKQILNMQMISKKWLDGTKIKAIIVDPSAASFIAELRKRGYKVLKANNDVLDGIRFVASLLNQGKISISDQCPNTIKEFGSYIWDQKASERGEDKPVKQHDHAMDALRYFCYTIIRKPGGISILK